MAGEWLVIQFGQLLAEPVRNGIYKQKEFHGRGAKIVNMGELFAHPRLRAVPMKRVALSDSEAARFTLAEGDLLFARRSLVAEGAGKCSVVLDIDEPTTFESSIIRARPDRTKADPHFLYYFFNSTSGLHCLDTIRRQVAVAGITGSDLVKLELAVPPLPEQRAIAHILGTLDDKIELNRKLSETLEAMARALFKSWFVDFDPVRAKMEGRDTGLPREIADLFPSRMVESELGEIPEGWDVWTLGEVISQRLERCSPSDETRSRPYVPIECIAARSLLLSQSKPGGEAQSSLTRFYRGDLLFGAMRPYFHKVAIAPFDGTTRTTVFVLWPRIPDDFAFAALLLHDPKTIEYATNHSTGSTIPYAVWQGSLEAMPTVLPPKQIRALFNLRAKPLLDRLTPMLFETNALAALRDTLLPKLISGELRIPAAVSHFAEATA